MRDCVQGQVRTFRTWFEHVGCFELEGAYAHQWCLLPQGKHCRGHGRVPAAAGPGAAQAEVPLPAGDKQQLATAHPCSACAALGAVGLRCGWQGWLDEHD